MELFGFKVAIFVLQSSPTQTVTSEHSAGRAECYSYVCDKMIPTYFSFSEFTANLKHVILCSRKNLTGCQCYQKKPTNL